MEKLNAYNLRQEWWAILLYSVAVFGITQVIYLVSKHFYGEQGSIHIEVLLPAFVLGMVMKTRHMDSPANALPRPVSRSCSCFSSDSACRCSSGSIHRRLRVPLP